MRRATGDSFRLERELAGFLAREDVLRRGEHTLLLLSGGADSMALLHLLLVVGERLDLRLCHAALHVDYATRGADSDRDRGIVEEACARRGVPLHVVRLPRKLEGAAFQARARVLRYDHARRLAAAHGYDVLVTAHNRDDQAETIIYRLTKYASPRGLVGMRPREGFLARPLLDLGAEEIRAYCRRQGIAYGQDVSNLQAHYARNLIRLEVLPPLEKINPRAAQTLADAAALAAAEAGVIDAATRAALERASRDTGQDQLRALDVATLSGELEALQSLVLHEWLRSALGGHILVERRLVAGVLRLLQGGQDAGRVSIGRGLEVVRARGLLRLQPAGQTHVCEQITVDPRDLKDAGQQGVPVRFCGRRLRLRLVAGGVLDAGGGHGSVGLMKLPRHLTLRHPRRGERFAPLGLGAETTVLRYLSAARVPVEERSRALVLDVDGEAAWIAFTGTASRLRGRVAGAFRVDESSRSTVHINEEEG